MKILALVLARGGSKRLPGKNIRKLGGKPLILWTLEAVRPVSVVCDCLVSTDSKEIADVCRKAGALVPWLRPRELASDESTSVDAALHAIDWYEPTYGAVDGLMLLQPTSPFRRTVTIERAIELFSCSRGRSVIGVTPVGGRSLEATSVYDLDSCERKLAFASESSLELSSYAVNGAMYIVDPKYLRRTKQFKGEDACLLVMNDLVESLDIDTFSDFRAAEYFAGLGKM